MDFLFPWSSATSCHLSQSKSEDAEIHRDRPVVDVTLVEQDFCGHHLFDVSHLRMRRFAKDLVFIDVLDGGPVSDAWPYCQYPLLFFGIEVNILTDLRSWSDKAHLAGENIYQLRQLVKFVFPEMVTDIRYPAVAVADGKAPFLIRIRPHRPELEYPEVPVVFPNPQLAEENPSP